MLSAPYVNSLLACLFDGSWYVFRPTGERDDEYPTLFKYVLDGTEPAETANGEPEESNIYFGGDSIFEGPDGTRNSGWRRNPD